jgi:hypothetical protein
MPSDEPSREQLVEETERWFRRRGLPYSGLHDVPPIVLFARVLPVLLVTLVAELMTMSLNGSYAVPIRIRRRRRLTRFRVRARRRRADAQTDGRGLGIGHFVGGSPGVLGR